jgi:hypothetical protein
MKPLTYLSLLLGISATTALAALRPDATPDEVAAAKAECGSLGVMTIDPAELPEGVTMSDVPSAPERTRVWVLGLSPGSVGSCRVGCFERTARELGRGPVGNPARRASSAHARASFP